VNGSREHKDSSRLGITRSNKSHSIYVLVLPRVAPHLGRETVSACGALLLPDMVGVAAASTASNVCFRPAARPERGCALAHSASRA
jgi:hypothetical protein